ncbi:hypothetical protein [Streptomyces sp. NPDC091212]|uniref:hypothetical protein n=1 Tax=Streptomyces sp. NPDC091212 TaxID=3155191 RepID=UPI00343B3D5B
MTPDEVLKLLQSVGMKAVHADDWTPEWALSVIRENRSRYAHEPWMKAHRELSADLARDLAEETGVAPADISTVLLRAGARLGALMILGVLPSEKATEIMQMAADDLDRQAKAGEQP